MKTTLLIMAAGIGSRFGGGIKQLAPVGPNGEIIMDYSIHDAIKAGFNKIVFIIRKDIEADFRAIIGDRIEKICAEHGVEVGYAFQSLDKLPAGYEVPEGRIKPWGTGQAVLVAKDLLTEPFAVINADDYYGKVAFEKLHTFLTTEATDKDFCMAGFLLKNTLSDNGGVTRGVCQVNGDGYLTDVVETSDIVKTADGAAVNGQPLDADSLVSMNMWGLTPAYMSMLEEGFVQFLSGIQGNELKAEYLLPIHIGGLLRDNQVSVKVLSTPDKWFGVTYKEDKELVIQSFKELIAAGEYEPDLFSDL
ncbi:MAG: nucleotidyltransferase [Clostridia bacterium]|nr:nucleotidyltransferase [Clostridia bacterium]